MSDNPGWAAWRGGMDEALTQAFETLLWVGSCNGTATQAHSDPADCGGQDCDVNLDDLGFTADNFAAGAGREVEEDLHGFVTSCLAERPDCFAWCAEDPGQVGHDFILTRNGHGAGFWDRGLGELGKWLTGMAKPFGSQNAYAHGEYIYVEG
jgi:hypothetical protein